MMGSFAYGEFRSISTAVHWFNELNFEPVNDQSSRPIGC